MLFYHVDRNNSLSEGQDISLSIYKDVSPPELQHILDRDYPDGVSYHGERYYVNQANSESSTNTLIEHFLEYERLLQYPKKPSRLQSLFAFETKKDVSLWQQFFKKTNENASIWEIEVTHRNYCMCDAAWLNMFPPYESLSVLYIKYLMKQYWSGKFTSNPLPEVVVGLPAKIIGKVTL